MEKEATEKHNSKKGKKATVVTTSMTEQWSTMLSQKVVEDLAGDVAAHEGLRSVGHLIRQH